MQEENVVLSDKVLTPALVEPRGRLSILDGLKQALVNAALRHFYLSGQQVLFRESMEAGSPETAEQKEKKPGGKQEVFSGQGAET